MIHTASVQFTAEYADPQWGWGWIGWSDLFYAIAPAERDPDKAEKILRRALEVQDLRDRLDALDRLLMLYQETGRPAEAKEVERLMNDERLKSRMAPMASFNAARHSPELSPLPHDKGPVWNRTMHSPMLSGSETGPSTFTVVKTKQKTGRNDPCSCGSGKKFKKCCLR